MEEDDYTPVPTDEHSTASASGRFAQVEDESDGSTPVQTPAADASLTGVEGLVGSAIHLRSRVLRRDTHDASPSASSSDMLGSGTPPPPSAVPSTSGPLSDSPSSAHCGVCAVDVPRGSWMAHQRSTAHQQRLRVGGASQPGTPSRPPVAGGGGGSGWGSAQRSTPLADASLQSSFALPSSDASAADGVAAQGTGSHRGERASGRAAGPSSAGAGGAQRRPLRGASRESPFSAPPSSGAAASEYSDDFEDDKDETDGSVSVAQEAASRSSSCLRTVSVDEVSSASYVIPPATAALPSVHDTPPPSPAQSAAGVASVGAGDAHQINDSVVSEGDAAAVHYVELSADQQQRRRQHERERTLNAHLYQKDRRLLAVCLRRWYAAMFVRAVAEPSTLRPRRPAVGDSAAPPLAVSEAEAEAVTSTPAAASSAEPPPEGKHEAAPAEEPAGAASSRSSSTSGGPAPLFTSQVNSYAHVHLTPDGRMRPVRGRQGSSTALRHRSNKDSSRSSSESEGHELEVMRTQIRWVMKPSTRTAAPPTTTSSSSSSSSTPSSPVSSSSLLSNEAEYARLQRTKQELNDAYWRNLARKAERDNAAAAAAAAGGGASASLPPQSRSDLSTQPHLRDDAAFFSHPHSGDRSLVSGAPDDVACAPASTPAAAAGTAPSQRSTPPESLVAEQPSRQRALSLLSSPSAPAAGAGEGSTSSGGAPAAAVLATVLPERHDGEAQTVVHTEADGDTSSTDSSVHGDAGADTVHSMPPLEDTLKPKQRAGETAATTTIGAEDCPDGAAEVSEHAAYSEDEFESLGSSVTEDGEPQDTDAQSNDATPSRLADAPPAESATPESSPHTSLSGPPPDETCAAAASVAEVTGGAASPGARSDGACPPVERGDSVKVEDETAPLHHEAQSHAPAAESSVQPLEAIVEEEGEEEEENVASAESVEAEEGRPEIVETSPPPEGEDGAMYGEAASTGATPSAEPAAVWIDSWPPREAQSEPPLPPPQQPLMDANESEGELEQERRQLQRAREEVERLRQLVRDQEQQQQLEQQQREHDLQLERERVRLEREQLEMERQRWQQQQQEAAQEEEQQRHHQQQQQQQQLVGNELQQPQPEQFVDLRSQGNDQGRGQTPHSEAEPSQSAPTGIEGDHGQASGSTSPLSHDVVPSLVESSARSSPSSLPPQPSSVEGQQEQSMPLSVADAGDSVAVQVIREEEEDEGEEGEKGSAGQRSEEADAQSDPRRSSASSSSSCRVASVDAASSQHATSHDTPQPAAASASADSASSQHTTASSSASTSSSSSSVPHLRSSSESASDVAELASMLSQHRPQTAQSLRSAAASLHASLTPSAMAQSVGGSHGSRAATPPAPPAAGAAVGHSSPGLPLYPPPAHSQRSSSSRSPSQEAGSQRSPSSLPPPAVQLGRCGHPGRLPERSSYISRTPSLGSVQRDGQAEAYDGDVLQCVSGAVSAGGHTPRANSVAARSHTPSVAELLSAVLGEVHVAESDSSSDRRDGENAEGESVSAHAMAHQQSSTPTADDGKRGGSASRRPSRHRDAGPAYATSLLPKTQLALQVMRARSTSLPGRSLSPAAPVTYDYGEEEAEDELPSVAFPVSIYAGFGGATADAGVGTRGGANESDEGEAAEGKESGHGEWLPSGVFDARGGSYGAASPGWSDGDKDDDCARTVSGGGTEERADWAARDGGPGTQHEAVPALNSSVDASGLGGTGELREKGQPVTAEAAAGQDGAVGLEDTDSSAALRGGDRVSAAAPAEEGRQDDKGTGGRTSTTGGQGGAHPDDKTAGSQASQCNTRDGTSATPASKADGEKGEEEKEKSGADAYQHPQRHGAGERRSSETQPSNNDGRDGSSGQLLATPNDHATASSGSRGSASSRPERRPSRSSAGNVPQTALPAVATTTTTTTSSSSASSSGTGTSTASSRSPAAEAALKGLETGSRVLQDGAGEKGGMDALGGSTVGVDVPHHDAPQARPLHSSPPSGLGQGGEGHSHAAREQAPHAHTAASGGRGDPPQPSAASTDGNHQRGSHPPSPLPERHTAAPAPVAGTSPPPQWGPAAAATPYPHSQRSDTADEAGLPSVDMPLLSPREASDLTENPPRPARSRQLRLASGDAPLAIAPVPALNTSSTHAGQHSTSSDAALAHHGSADAATPYPADCADGGVNAGAASSAGVRTPASSALPREGASLASCPESVQWGSAAAPSWQRASRHRTPQLDYDGRHTESGDGGVPLPPHVFGVGQPQPPHRRRPSRTPRLSDLQSSGEDDRAAEREEGRREASSVLSSPAVDEHYLSITRDRTPGMDRDSRGGWAAHRPGEGRDGREPTQAPADSRGTHEPVDRSPMTGAGLHRYAPRTRSPLAAMPSTHPYCYRDLMDGASAIARVPSSAFHPAVTAASASADKGTHLAHSPHLVDSAQQQQPSSLPRSLLDEKRAPTPGSSESESRAEDDKTSDDDGNGDDGGVGMVAEPGSHGRPHRERTRGARHHDPASRHRRHNKHHRPHRSDGASAGKHDGRQGTEQGEEQSEGPAHRRDSHRKKEKGGHHAVDRGAHQHSDDDDDVDVDRVREDNQGSGAGPTTPPPSKESRAPRMAGGGIDPRDSRYVAQEAALSPTVGRLYADPRYSPTHPYDWQGTTPSLLSTPQQGRLTGRDAEAAVAHSEKAAGEDGVVVVPRGDGSGRPRRPHHGEHKPHRSRHHHRHRPSGVGSGIDGLKGGHSASPPAPDSRSGGSSRSSSARSPSASSSLADDGRGSHPAGTRDEARKDEQGHTAPSRRSSKLAGGSSSQSSPPQPRPPAQPRQHGDGAPPPYDRERGSAKAAGAQEEGPAEAEAGAVAVPTSHQLVADGGNSAGEEEKETGSSRRHRRLDQPSRSRTHRHAQPLDALAPPSPAGREDDDSNYDKKDEENTSRPAPWQHASPGVVRAVTPWTASASSPPHARHEHAVQQPMPRGAHRHAAPAAHAVAQVPPSEGRPGELYYCDSDGAFHRIENDDELREVLAAAAAAGGRDRPPLYVVHHPGSCRALSPQAGRSVSPMRQQQASPPRRVWTITDPKAAVGCSRLNPYCATCRQKYNLIFVDAQMRPLRWPSPRSKELEAMGDCRTHSGYVFAAADVNMGSDATAAAAFSRQPTLGERRERALYTREWPELAHVRADQLLVSEEDVDRPLRQLTPPPRGRFVPVSYTTQESGVPLRQPVAYTHGGENRSRSGAARDASGQPTTRPSRREADSGWKAASEAKRSVDGRPGERSSDFSYGDADGALLPPSRGSPALRERQRAVRQACMPSPIAKEGRSRVSLPPSSLSSFPTNSSSSTTMDRRGNSRSSQVDGDQHGAAADAGSPTDRSEAAQRKEERRIKKALKQLLWRDLPQQRGSPEWERYMQSLSRELRQQNLL